MRPVTLKTIVLTSASIIALLIAMQMVWLSRIYHNYDRYTEGTLPRQELTLWLAGTIVLVLVLIGLAVVLISFYRKRYIREIEKDFLNNFMHEFKTPLAVMGIAGKVLSNPGIERQPGRLQKYAGIVKEQSEQLEHKVNRILEVALSDRKQVALAKEDIEVNTMVTRTIAFLQPLIDERSAAIEFTAGPEPLRIYADAIYFNQVLINLLENSLKFASKPHIKIGTARTEKMCIISVRDNGIGIEKKYHKDIFRKFYRVPTGNVHNVKGFGIGLNFAKKVVDAHQGRIVVESMPGIGSEFSILMPLI
ncbi:MAG TPA: HAMP domain-containing sensor histidine kinase [Chitinophagaceae bacterium]|nr:HAMP domain-containing sensor histidine kinase [Chitinophagaceae bacterium]